jgi:hypothetical protein
MRPWLSCTSSTWPFGKQLGLICPRYVSKVVSKPPIPSYSLGALKGLVPSHSPGWERAHKSSQNSARRNPQDGACNRISDLAKGVTKGHKTVCPQRYATKCHKTMPLGYPLKPRISSYSFDFGGTPETGHVIAYSRIRTGLKGRHKTSQN